MYLLPPAVHLQASHTFIPASSFSRLSFSRLTTLYLSPWLRHHLTLSLTVAQAPSHSILQHGSGLISPIIFP